MEQPLAVVDLNPPEVDVVRLISLQRVPYMEKEPLNRVSPCGFPEELIRTVEK